MSELRDILQGAYATSDNTVLSYGLAPHQHVCHHGTGEVIVWDFNKTIKAFYKQAFHITDATLEEKAELDKLHAEARALWRSKLITRAASIPEKALKFEHLYKEQWIAKVKGGSVTLSPTTHGVRFTCSFGANSDKSFSGFMPGCDLEDAKKYVHAYCMDSLPSVYN